MSLISPLVLKSKIENKESFQLIDVREAYEFDEFNIGGINIPLGQVFSDLDQLKNNIPIIFCCSSGKKSKAILHSVKRKLAITEVFSLDGGIEAYAAMG